MGMMPNRLGLVLRWSILLGLSAILLGGSSTAARHDARLMGCRAMGIDPFYHTDSIGMVNYSLVSPAGTYVAVTSRPYDHGCISLALYQCVKQQVLGRLGCTADMPWMSYDRVLADSWVSDDELRIQRLDYRTDNIQMDVIDVSSLPPVSTPIRPK